MPEASDSIMVRLPNILSDSLTTLASLAALLRMKLVIEHPQIPLGSVVVLSVPSAAAHVKHAAKLAARTTDMAQQKEIKGRA